VFFLVILSILSFDPSILRVLAAAAGLQPVPNPPIKANNDLAVPGTFDLNSWMAGLASCSSFVAHLDSKFSTKEFDIRVINYFYFLFSFLASLIVFLH
jgi:hypothetical protein